MSITVLAVEPPAVGSALRAQARELAQRLAAVVGEVDVAAGSGALAGAEAAELVATLAEIERLAAAGKTLAAGRVAETGHYRALAFPSPARWLADATGEGVGEAGRLLVTAAHLGDADLGATRAAFVAGSLTASQASEIARTAASAPGQQARLLSMVGRETTARLRGECRKIRLAGRPAEDPETRRKRVAEEMAFGARDLGDGMGELFARMPSAWLVLVSAAVREQCEAIFERARAEGRTDPHAAYLVEALVSLLLVGNLGGAASSEVADRSDGVDGVGFDDPLYAQLLASVSGDPPPLPPPRGTRRRMRRGRCSCGGRVAPRAKILIRVDQSALLRGWAEGDETCDIAGIGPVPVATVRQLWPDAVAKLVVTSGVDVKNVTHLGRRATEAMTTALQWAGSSACSNIACDNDRFVEIDHRRGWANVHRPRLDELDGLCSQCHGHKTRDNWQLVRGRGRRRFVPPGHPDHPGDPPTPHRRS